MAIQCVGLMLGRTRKPARALSEKNALDCHGATRLAMMELMKGPKQRSWLDQQPVIASPQGVAIQGVGLMLGRTWKPARALSEKNALDCHGATRLAMTELMRLNAFHALGWRNSP